MPEASSLAAVDAAPDPATGSPASDATTDAALADLLKKARAASPDHRIEWRDPIAAYGAPAIEAVRPWLSDTRLAAFAVRVIDRTGCSGEAELASQVLRSGRSRVPPNVVTDVEWALQHIRAVNRPDPGPGAAPGPAVARPAARRPSPRPDRRSHRP